MGWQALDETGGKCRCGNVNFNTLIWGFQAAQFTNKW